jgi:D-threo-aldose 1-dehydrogenase
MADPTVKVSLGRTGLEVTRFGLGSAAFGWMYTPVAESQAQAAVRRAYELGCRFFDTSPYYGTGLAETRVGAVLSTLPRDSFVLSDKIGYAVYPETPLPVGDQPPPHPGFDYSYDGAFRLVEGNLKRLGLDRIDILLIHDPDDYIEEALKGTYRALRKMRDEGMIKAIGAGMNFSNLLTRLAREAEFDCFLMAGRYTLLDQAALADLLPVATEQGIGIYIGGPFNSGILADPYAANATFNYNSAPAEWVAKAQKIDKVCQRYGVPLKAAAIQFPLGHPAVVSVLSGARSVAELEENMAMFQVEIPDELWQDLIKEGLLPEGIPLPAKESPNA